MLEELINLGEHIKASNLKQSSKYKNLVKELSHLEVLDLCDKLILLCLQADINCQPLINAMSDCKEKIITEDELRKIVFTVLA